MASPCEVLIDCDNRKTALRISRVVAEEAWRIEEKWSRYISGNIIHRINNAAGKAITVDGETGELLSLADKLWQLSQGRFDITSGILRQAWRFDGSDNIPSNETIQALLPRIGWQQARWQSPKLTLAAGMELDFGGIGKEYAADRCLALAKQVATAPILVNLGGDIASNGPQKNGLPWRIGVDADRRNANTLMLNQGGIATSGDAYRYLIKDGKRYSHVLDATTGWPVEAAPHSVTVAAPTCTQAGILSTLAMLHGAKAEEFLADQGVKFQVQR